MKKICITGGGGYVGSQLVPYLLNQGYEVTVLDKCWYGFRSDVFASVANDDRLNLWIGDIRNPEDLDRTFKGQDAVIHLACISNDPSFELDPDLGRSINLDCFPDILKAVKRANIKRFIYASSSSVYGVQPEGNVTEKSACKPLTDYSKFKLLCEDMLTDFNMGSTEWVILRPATVCGWAPRLRLDLAVNIMTIQALVNKKMTVFGGQQLRPNINIKDMVRAYAAALIAPKAQAHRQVFNVGFENKTILEIAQLVQKNVGGEIVVDENAADTRSYQVNSDKIEYEMGFTPKSSIESAIRSLKIAYDGLKIKNPMTNSMYHNLKRMKEINR